MRHTTVISVVAALVAGGSIAAHSLADDPSTQAAERTETLRLYSVANLDAEVYVRANGAPPPTSADDVATPGDVSILEDRLFRINPHNEPTGNQLGTSNGQCTFVAVQRPSFTELRADALCSAVITLPNGTITLDGIVAVDFSTNARDVYSITGGTGTYSGARGSATVTGVPNDPEAAIYELRLVT